MWLFVKRTRPSSNVRRILKSCHKGVHKSQSPLTCMVPNPACPWCGNRRMGSCRAISAKNSYIRARPNSRAFLDFVLCSLLIFRTLQPSHPSKCFMDSPSSLMYPQAVPYIMILSDISPPLYIIPVAAISPLPEKPQDSITGIEAGSLNRMLPETTSTASKAGSGVSAGVVSTAGATANAAAGLVAKIVGDCIEYLRMVGNRENLNG